MKDILCIGCQVAEWCEETGGGSFLISSGQCLVADVVAHHPEDEDDETCGGHCGRLGCVQCADRDDDPGRAEEVP